MIDVCCALIFCRGRLLAVQRGKHPDHPNEWELPGGKIEPAETAFVCIQREILEELNLVIKPTGFLFPVQHDYGTKQIRLFPFLATISDGNLELNEHENACWLSENELYRLHWQKADLNLIRLNEKQILDCLREDDNNG